MQDFEMSHEMQMEELLAQQATELGITPEDVKDLDAQIGSGEVTFSQVLGLTEQEMSAMAYRAEEHLRNRNPGAALKIFTALNKLNRYEYRFWRGSALCFHHMEAFEFARGYYGMALATNPDDRISEALSAECTLRIDGPKVASAALTVLLAKGASKDPLAESYLERARVLQDKLLAMPGIRAKPQPKR